MLLFTPLLFVVACKNAQDQNPLVDLSTFQIEDGFQIELVVGEPLIADPVDMEIDEYGRWMVVEMHGYPLDVSGSGVVKRLVDTNGDGLPDESTVFADSLVLPTGIMRWKKGWLVTDPPNVLYLEDTDDDGRADVKEVILTGFARSNPQHNVNNPQYGIDNWIYLSHEGAIRTKSFADVLGDEGEDVHFPNIPNSPSLGRNANGLAVRFQPDKEKLESLAARGQFGHTFDPWGHHFVTSNADHLFHMAIEARYMNRNENLLIPSGRYYMPRSGKGFEIYPITTNPDHQLLTDIGMITSACGILWYNGGLFPDDYQNTIFTAEPVHNLIHLDRIEGKGATFEAINMLEKREFLASTDSWFRPVNHYIGPDGAIYVLDYYRKIIEHPEWLSDEVIQSGDLYAGKDKGRIYRITPKGSPAMDFLDQLDMGNWSNEQLIQQLEKPNIWWRMHAQRLLMDRGDATITGLLNAFLKETISPVAKVHAAWLLEGKGQLDAAAIQRLLNDPVAGVRENAVKLAERHLDTTPKLEESLLALQNDQQPKVLYQLLLTLGDLTGDKIENVRKNVLLKNIDDPWMHYAALSSPSMDLLDWYGWATIALADQNKDGSTAFLKKLTETLARSTPTGQLNDLLADVMGSGDSDWSTPIALEGLSQAIRRRPQFELSGANTRKLIRNYQKEDNPNYRNTVLNLLQATQYFLEKDNRLFKAALKTVRSDEEDEFRLVEALEIIGWTDAKGNLDVIKKILEQSNSNPVRLAAMEAIGQANGEEVTDLLVALWPQLLPLEREEGIRIFLKNNPHRLTLLKQIEANHIQAATLSWPQKVSLLNSGQPEIRSLARQLLQGSELNADELWASYEPCLSQPGNLERGALVFKQNCGICHQKAGQNGIAYGPDLASVQNRNKASLLLDILQPNRSIADGYELWTVTLGPEEQMSGVITQETPSAITLRNAAGQDQTISRSTIQSITASEISAMPEQLHQQISVEEMGDLLSYLKGEE